MAARPPGGAVVAARRYASLVAPIARRYANPVTGRPLTGAELLLKVSSGENHFSFSGVSSAGARGPTQFTADSRAEAIRKFGLDPWKNYDQAFHATALHLLGKINGSTGLEGYNPGGGRQYVDYILGQRLGAYGHRGAAPAGGGGGGGSAAGAGGTVPAVTPSSAAGTGTEALLATLLNQRPRIQASAPAAPAGAAGPTLPKGYTAPASSGPPQPKIDVASLLAGLKPQTTDPASAAPQPAAAGGGGGGGSAPVGGPGARGGYAYPLARRGKIIGTPYSGTHTLGNWQSDNAVDIATPVGTPVRSIQGGRVVKVVRHPQDGGRFAGDQVTIEGPGGGVFFTHLSKTNVRPGQRVKRGQVIGRSGSANGVAHLHIGRERGNPLREFG